MGVKRWSYHRNAGHEAKPSTDELLPGEDSPGLVRIHLGCGEKYIPGWINVDHKGRVDYRGDITFLPFAENYADEIMGIHCFEHLWPDEAVVYLKHWAKILKPGGKLVLEMPDFKKIIQLAAKGSEDPNYYTLAVNAVYGFHWTLNSLHGPVRKDHNVYDLHKWCWTFDTLAPKFREAGLEPVEERPLYHYPIRDFRIVGTKCDVTPKPSSIDIPSSSLGEYSKSEVTTKMGLCA